MRRQPDEVNILIVDDRADKRLALEAVLDDLKENIVPASSGREALRHVLRMEFAVILLDIAMPGMDGFETAALIRQYRGSRHTPIIFVTSAGEDLFAQRSYSLGAVDYILAPVIPEVLRTKVSVFVELFRKSAEMKRQAEAIARKAALLRKLAHVSLTISAAGSIDAVLKLVTGAARELLGASIAITTFATEGPAGPTRNINSMAEPYVRFRAFRPPLGPGGLYALARGAGGCMRKSALELEGRPEWLAETRDAGGPPLRGMLSAPLTEGSGRSVGFILLSDKAEGEFSEDDEAVLIQLAQLASITFRNFLRADAREANRLKDELLALLSRELRAPIQTALDRAHALRAEPADPERLARGLALIEGSLTTQIGLVDELLDMARLAAGEVALDLHELALAPLVEAAVGALRPAAEARRIALAASLEGQGLVLGDEDRLLQVISKVLDNALEYTPNGGKIEVRLRREPAWIELWIRDDGEGISDELLPFVFEHFRTAERATRRSHGGLGIGLSIVRRLVELHDGSVFAESPGLGKGSTFRIRLPALAESGRSRDASTPESAPRAPASVG
jgi:signal transduction histidine kinase/FixJ family two-component response regulator